MSGLRSAGRVAQAATLLDTTGITRLLTTLGGWRGTLVLTYHRIAAAGATPEGDLWSADEEELNAQLDYLTHNVEVKGPEELLEGGRRSGRSVMITFDDGYRDNFELAFPLLRAYGVPATFFITSGFIDRPRPPWWDEIRWMVHRASGPGPKAEDLIDSYKRLPADDANRLLDEIAEQTGAGRQPATDGSDLWMTWDMVRELRAAGMSVGGHTVNHPVLSRLSEDQQRREILGCRQRLAEELGIEMELFAYPVGLRDSFDQRTVSCLREAGVSIAFSYYGGYASHGVHDWYDVPRTSVWLGMQPRRFRGLTALPQAFARC